MANSRSSARSTLKVNDKRSRPDPAKNISPSKIRLYTIVYSEQTALERDADTLILDNTENHRPDWREYWAIRNFLLYNKLDPNAYYGFFSPKFPSKIGLSAAGISKFISGHGKDIDVFTFSPQADMGTFFLNVFEQGETFDPGFMAASRMALDAIGLNVDLNNLVMDSRHIVFSNFFIAKKVFWERWLQLCETIFIECEAGESPLALSLTHSTTYPGGVQRKVFLVERIASLMLKLEPWEVKPYSTFKCAWSSLPTANFRHEAVVSDALKLAHNESSDVHYLDCFAEVRRRVFFPRK